MIAVGVDPGAHTGLLALELPDPRRINLARWLASTVLRPSARADLTAPESDGELHERIYGWLRTWRPNLVVLEEPADAMISWRGHAKQRRGTAFRLGAYYGLAVIAACRTGARVQAYPVQNRKAESRPGWMQGRKAAAVLPACVALGRHLRAPAETFTLTPKGEYRFEHVFMALGVLAFHLAQFRAPAGAADDIPKVLDAEATP